MAIKIRSVIWAASLLLSYPLYAIGQLYMFYLKREENDFYKLLNSHEAGWVNAHLLLMLGVVLLIPAFFAICHFFRNTRGYLVAGISTVLIFVTVFSLFGQFTIDLCLVEVFKLPEQEAYKVLDDIQNNTLIKGMFYDNSTFIPWLKYADLTFLSHLLLGVAMVVSKKVPVWAIVIFILAFLLTQFGILIHPVYGRIIKRASYALISVSWLPIALNILRFK